MDNFMTAIPARSKDFGPGAIAYGLQGKINGATEGFVQSTFLVAGQGVKSTMKRWGWILTQLSRKSPHSLYGSDLSISHLGYYTDNGAYYYYKTEKGKNYQQTMLDVKAEAQKLGIPFRYFQFDSWWYYKDSHSAVTLWEPRPDVFPDGMSQWLGMPLVLHNRWWSPENKYNQSWFIDEARYALPKSEDLFDYIMAKAKKWGMIVYEQDWLVTTYEKMNVTQATLHDAQSWLIYMGYAALKLNITIQYCMPLPMHMLQSTSLQAVSHARASGDYHPGNSNWNIGLTSLFYWSIGVVPFKDDFFTYHSREEGCPYGILGCTEPNYQLQALVALMSGGPVGPSDGIEYLNKELIMRTCRGDGLLLKPEEPAIFHDAAFKAGFANQKRYEIWHTYTNISDDVDHYIITIDLEDTVQITLEDLGEAADAKFMAFDYFESCPLGQEHCSYKAFQKVDSATPLQLKATKTTGETLEFGAVMHQYVMLMRTLPNGWTPIGENLKFMPKSSARYTSAFYNPSKPEVWFAIAGLPKEEIMVFAVLPSAETANTTVILNDQGQTVLTCIGSSVADLKCSYTS